MGEVVPAEAARALASMDQARAAIAAALEARDAEALSNWRDVAAAARHYAARREDAAALAADAGEIKIRAERALGKLDVDANPEHRGVATPAVATPDVNPNTRAAWRKLGQVPDDGFETIVGQLRQDDLKGVTTANASRLAREYLPAKPKPRVDAYRRRQQEAQELTRRLDQIASDALWVRDNAARHFGYVGGSHDADRLRDKVVKIEERLAAIREVLWKDHYQYRKEN